VQCGWGYSRIYWQNVKFGRNSLESWFGSSINNYVRNEAHCFKKEFIHVYTDYTGNGSGIG